jgi:O-acetyl-ADP-ribose deacetylase (regulator of RNase III)
VIEVLRADITTLDVDAVVNAANSALAGGGGVDGAIHRAAGPELALASRRLAPCPPGHAVITPAFRLRARHVIHAVGPVWQGGDRGEPDTLRRAYEAALRVARDAGDVRTIAFPGISTGIYAFPKPLAAAIALDVMRAHVAEFDRIVACTFDEESRLLYERLLARASDVANG